jgi:PAS domain S-box-containing protein
MANSQKRAPKASKITSPFQPKASRKAKEKTAPKSGKPRANMQRAVAASKPRNHSLPFKAQETKELYDALFQNHPAPMWIYDAKTLNILAANKAATRRYGYSKREFASMTVAEILMPDDAPNVLKAIERANKKKTYSMQWLCRTKSGKQIAVRVQAQRMVFAGNPAWLVRASETSELTKAEKQAQEQYQRFNLFFNQALDGLYFMMLDKPVEWYNAPDKEAALDYIFSHQRMTEANDAILAQYGMSREEFLGRTPADFYAHDIEYGRRIWRENLDRGRQIVIRDERRADGSQIWVEGQCVPLFNAEGKFIGHFGIQRDITERKKYEEALRASEDRYRLAAENTGQLIYDLDLATGQIQWAGAILQVTGFTPEEFAQINSQEWKKLIHPDDYVIATKELEHAILTKMPYHVIYRFKRKDGTYIYVEDNGDFLLDAHGKPYRMVGAMKDITERKQAEAKLKEQSMLIDSMRDAVIIRDLDGRILFWNKGAELIYGFSASEVMNKSAAKILWSENQDDIKQIVQNVLRAGHWSGELKKRRKTGEELRVESNWILTYNEQEKQKAIITIDRDVTERWRLQEQFLRAQRLDSLGRLAGGIAHDLNNIFTPMLLSLELLETKLSDEKSQKWIKTLQRNLERGTQLVQQILNFARGTTGDMQPCNLANLMQELIDFIKNTFPKNILIKTQVAEDLPLVKANPTQIYQALLNLAVNARDAMPAGGELTFHLEPFSVGERNALIHLDAKIGQYVCISVSDTGTGMSPEVLDKIFEPFFTTKEVGKGTGLGLSTVFSIVKHHQGFINVYSELGKGTVFRVYLPVWQQKIDTGRQETAQAQAQMRRGQGEYILVIDDEAAVCDSVKSLLTAHGYSALTALTGQAGIELLKQHQESIVAAVVDMSMADMDGLKTVQALRKISPTLKIIVASGFLDSERITLLKRENVEAFLQKPFEAAKLLQALAEAHRKA